MRTAVLIISLVLAIVVGFQSCAVSFGASMLADEELDGASAIGLLVMIAFIIGGAFALNKPHISKITLIIAGVLGLIGGLGSEFSDLTIWALIAFALAYMSHKGIAELKTKELDQ